MELPRSQGCPYPKFLSSHIIKGSHDLSVAQELKALTDKWPGLHFSDSGHLFPHQVCCWCAPESEWYPQWFLGFYVLEQRLEPGTQRPWWKWRLLSKITLQGLQTGRVLKALLGHLHRTDHMHFSTAGFVFCLLGFVIVLFCLSMLCPCM